MTTSNEHNNAPAVPQGWKLVPVEPTPEMIRCAEMWDEGFEGAYARALAATPAPAPAQGEPFGYFRAEPFGWTDCAKDDEGAIALYERPQEVGLTDEEWLEYLLRNAPKDVLSMFAVVGGSIQTQGKWIPLAQGFKAIRFIERAIALRAKGQS